MTSPAPPHPKTRQFRSKLARWLRQLIIVSAYAYPLALLGCAWALVGVGEDWWLTAGLLYVPRLFFGLPLLVLVPALLWLRCRRELAIQGVTILVWLFPLMGLVLPWPAPASSDPALKLLSFNINNAYWGLERLLPAIDAAKADVVLLQESPAYDGPVLEAMRARYPHVERSTQFLIASRFPIVERTDPEKIPSFGRDRSPRFMRYVVDSNLGKVAIYSIHPISPRGTLGVRRVRELLHRVRSGEILKVDPESDLGQNASLRLSQIAAAATMASKERLPVLLAGDTNLPGLSAAFERYLGDYQDGFEQASSGFGYTFPTTRGAFLRLDRILAGPGLGFRDFQVGCPGVSDHFCVMASVGKR